MIYFFLFKKTIFCLRFNKFLFGDCTVWNKQQEIACFENKFRKFRKLGNLGIEKQKIRINLYFFLFSLEAFKKIKYVLLLYIIILTV